MVNCRIAIRLQEKLGEYKIFRKIISSEITTVPTYSTTAVTLFAVVIKMGLDNLTSFRTIEALLVI